MTPALLAACRRNAQKSTGPRTEWGKIQSSMNGLKNGSRSPAYQMLFPAFIESMGESTEEIAQRVLTPEERRHPVLAEHVLHLGALEIALAANFPRPYRKRKASANKGEPEIGRSGQHIENKRPTKAKVLESRQLLEKSCA
jgi:hypothetical protein